MPEPGPTPGVSQSGYPTRMTINCGCNCCAPVEDQPCTEGCCRCQPSGNLSFDIIDCQAYYVCVNPIDGMDNWCPIDSCCTGMNFGLKRSLGYMVCTMSGHEPSTVDDDGNSCLTTGIPGGPTGTGIDTLPELWGFTGTICNDCQTIGPRDPSLPITGGWGDPHFHQEDCNGMCVRESVCCCVSPNSGGSTSSGPRCGGGASLAGRKQTCRCSTQCYKFTMEPFDCHEIDRSVICPPRTGTFMSACSPCSFIQGPVKTGIVGDLPPLPSYTGCSWDCETYPNETGSSMGAWDAWGACPPATARAGRECGVIPHTGSAQCSGQCPNTGVGGGFTREFMLLVDGVIRSQCDCATGVLKYMCGEDSPYGLSGVGVMENVFIKFTGLVSTAS